MIKPLKKISKYINYFIISLSAIFVVLGVVKWLPNFIESNLHFFTSNKELQENNERGIASLDSELYNYAASAIVSIETKEGWGTGFFISEKGILLTNRHVANRSNPITSAASRDNKKYWKFKFLLEDSFHDIAIFRHAGEVKNFLSLEDKKYELNILDDVFSIGNPRHSPFPYYDGTDLNLAFTGVKGKIANIESKNYLFSHLSSPKDEQHGGEEGKKIEQIWPDIDPFFFGKIHLDMKLFQGGSGSPILNSKGKIVGILHSTIRENVGSQSSVKMIDILRPSLMTDTGIARGSSLRAIHLLLNKAIDFEKNETLKKMDIPRNKTDILNRCLQIINKDQLEYCLDKTMDYLHIGDYKTAKNISSNFCDDKRVQQSCFWIQDYLREAEDLKKEYNPIFAFLNRFPKGIFLVILFLFSVIFLLWKIVSSIFLNKPSFSNPIICKKLANLNEAELIQFQTEFKQVQKDGTAGVLLALFLGAFGGHRYYMGQTGIGLLYTLFFWTGIPSLISIVEIFLMPSRVRYFNEAKTQEIIDRIVFDRLLDSA